MNDSRPNPDDLLAQIKSEEKSSAPKATLRVFLGMCPGVGKTYAMLQAAHLKAHAGCDVVVGVVETHGRSETAALVNGLEIVPLREIEHRDTILKEMDVDAILKRRPQFVLVDEMAHTNAEGSRHPKRYQDVLELLDAGISVFTTINVQHLESRVDVVRQITGVQIRETVPDSILDRADEVQLIDVSPDQLRQRLSEGKVYLGERAEAAAVNFFKEGNLTALREMALRFTAERVDRDMRGYMRERGISRPWKSSERLLVAVGPSPFSESLIRWTRKAAASQDATWLAVYIETHEERTPEEKDRVTKTLSLARQLGGEVVFVEDSNVAEGILRVAAENNVSQIVVGKTKEFFWWRLFKGGTLVDKLLHESGSTDLYVVDAGKDSAEPKAPSLHLPEIHAQEWGWGLGITAATTFLGLGLEKWIGYWSVSLFYLSSVVLASLFLGRWSVMLLATLSAFLWNFLFIPPKYTFYISEFHDAMMFLMMFVVAIAMGHLTTRLREREKSERERQRRSAALLQLTQYCTLEKSLEAGLMATIRLIGSHYDAQVVLYLRTDDHQLSPIPHPASSWQPPEKEHAVAEWVYGHREPAGRHTTTLQQSEGLYIPLRTQTSCMGVIGIKLGHQLDIQQRELLDAFAAQIALSLEKDHFRAAFQHAEMVEQSEKLRRTLLDNVSHELKTPVAAIITASSALRDQTEQSSMHHLVKEITLAAKRLERVVSLLVDSARMETGLIQPHPEWCDVTEIIHESLATCSHALAGRDVQVHFTSGGLLVKCDPRLVEQLLTHLLNNAAVHTPPATPVEILGGIQDGKLSLVVADRGNGLPEPTHQIFEKFYRGREARVGGLGLGLSIAKGLALSMKGDILARNRVGGGAEFIITIPVETQAEGSFA